jgi:NADP-dependent 3-hydroxy acid dehydrogenase YdfG
MQSQNVLVFAATSAVAQGVCHQLCKSNSAVNFFFVARNSDKLAKVCDVFSGHLSGSHVLDLLQPSQQQINHLMLDARRCMGGIDLIFIAQGDLFDQQETEQNATLLHQSLQLNAVSVMSLISSALTFQQSYDVQACKFLVLTSVAGDRGRPRNFTYGAGKKAVSTFLQGLRSVYYRSGFEFYDIRLGPVDSPMTAHHRKNFSFSSIDHVSVRIVKILSGRRYIAYVPGFWRAVMLVVRLLPECLFQKLTFLSAR